MWLAEVRGIMMVGEVQSTAEAGGFQCRGLVVVITGMRMIACRKQRCDDVQQRKS
jgi:hypothetical protein